MTVVRMTYLGNGVMRQHDWARRCKQLIVDLHRPDGEPSSLLGGINLEVCMNVLQKSMHDLQKSIL